MNWSVYMMVCDAGDGFNFCKIGMSGDLAKRVGQVQIGCPLPITDVAYMEVPAGKARMAENTIHQKLRPFHTQGEWFRLNLTDPAHKAAFQDATNLVIKRFGVSETQWKHMDIDAIRLVCRVLRLDKAA